MNLEDKKRKSITHVITNIQYPATKEHIIDHTKTTNMHQTIIELATKLPDHRLYHSQDELHKELIKLQQNE